MFLEQHNFKTEYSITDIFGLFGVYKIDKEMINLILTITKDKDINETKKRYLLDETLLFHRGISKSKSIKIINYILDILRREIYTVVDVKMMSLNEQNNWSIISHKFHFETLKESEDFIRDLETVMYDFKRKINTEITFNGTKWNSNEHRVFIEHYLKEISIIF